MTLMPRGGELREDALAVAHGAGVQAEGGGDGGAGDVGVQDADLVALLWPWRTARQAVVELLPTPPLPDMMA